MTALPAAPEVVIIGRPNVGKSLLFNRLVGQRRSIVHKTPGMTLDILRESVDLGENCRVWLTDTGGVGGGEDEWSGDIRERMRQAADKADLIILVTDARRGQMAGDADLARQLRRQWQAPWVVAVNKAEDMDEEMARADFLSLGAPETLSLSAKRGTGLAELRRHLRRLLQPAPAADRPALPSVAVVGRPNAGKSSLINRLLGQSRMIVSERPGTTRDTVFSELELPDGNLTLIDTAGMRRQRASTEWEKLSVAAARRMLHAADCALLVVDLSDGLTHQDKRIAQLAGESDCALVVVANKTDLLPPPARKAAVRRLLDEISPEMIVEVIPLSATGKRSLPKRTLSAALHRALAARQISPSTARLNQLLQEIVARNPPPYRGRVRPKLRYAHPGGERPLRIVIHGNATRRVDPTYRRYLASAFADALRLVGAPVKITLRSEENPYAGKS